MLIYRVIVWASQGNPPTHDSIVAQRDFLDTDGIEEYVQHMKYFFRIGNDSLEDAPHHFNITIETHDVTLDEKTLLTDVEMDLEDVG